MPWPRVSFTFLNSSRSTYRAAPLVPCLRLRARSCSMRSMIKARFGNPVNASCNAW